MRLTAAQLMNYLATGAEVMSESDDMTRGEQGSLAVLGETLAELAERYPEELEQALLCACANGLEDPRGANR